MTPPRLSLSIIVASGGRLSLAKATGSIIPQLTVYDELIVLVDQTVPYGHASRNRGMGWARGDWLAFCDDDEEWLPDAAETIRAGVATNTGAAHLFRALDPTGHEVAATGMIVVANTQPLATWGGGAEGLELFVHQTAKRWPIKQHQEAVVIHG